MSNAIDDVENYSEAETIDRRKAARKFALATPLKPHDVSKRTATESPAK